MQQVVARLVGASISSVERIYKGRNNRVYRLTCSDSESYVAKLYPKTQLQSGVQPGFGERDRLGSEFASLKFLWSHGLDCVPRPVASDPSFGCAVYEYIDGQEIQPSKITVDDIDQAVSCLVKIKALCNAEGSSNLPIAAEACFSFEEIFNNLDGRLFRLLAVPEIGGQYRALNAFLQQEFSPAFADIRRWCQSTLGGWGMSSSHALAPKKRTLSPSDFGFHNALKRPTGEIVFLDFEYFGWDDPAKMISDFLIHPAMGLNEQLKHRFVDNILSGFHNCEDLASRLTVAYPLFGLKWCMIILNEFLPEKLSRREFANGSPVDLNEVQSAQLNKAKVLLDRVLEQYQQFPYVALPHSG